MHPLDGLATMAEFAGKNTAFHLQHFPADKLAWKPSETAKSALEIVHHVSYFAAGMAPVIDGTGAFTPPPDPVPADLQTAQEMIRSSSNSLAAALRKFDMSRMGETVDLPFGSFPMTMVVSMPVFDLIHHHGQLAYIETVFGDTEDHFDI
jgi:hypothetical protein